MNRRLFIQSAFASLLLPYGIQPVTASPLKNDARHTDYLFFDERFAEARRTAQGIAPGHELTPVQGDMTDIWRNLLAEACRNRPLTLSGVTTESFHFCLHGMVQSVARAETRIIRINRNLFLWTINSNSYNNRMV